jgi:2-polyprenyl-6-methoxyphenol hydroxylase-like FAD-dependent oxidoreductase
MKTDVLIAGAGPTGLMAACQLKRFGVNCIIVDGKSGPTVESRALVVQPRSLEIYEQMGIADKAVENGQIIELANIIAKGKIKRTLPLGEIGKGISPFPFVLVYEQNKNEQLLLEYFEQLGGKVMWNTELVEVKAHNGSAINMIVKTGNNETLNIEAEYLMGADGARSVVRHELGFTFTGGTYENIFFVVDTEADWDFGYQQLFLCLSKATFIGMFGMKGHHRFRLIGIMPRGFKDKATLTFDDIENEVVSKMGIDVDFKKPEWFSVYRLHHRSVDKFSEGNVFLAGDAAHIHSPVGGQGMNTGLQDAYNLAWKLAYCIKGTASEKLLDTYNEERLPIAKRLVNTTDRAFSFVISQNWFIAFIRENIVILLLGIALRINRLRRMIFKVGSQTEISYNKNSLSQTGANDFSGSSPKAGDRVPYIHLYDDTGKRISVYELLKGACFHLLIFGVKEEIVTGLPDDLVKRIYIKDREKNKEIYSEFGIKTKGVFLIRPDNYIGFKRSNVSADELQSYFSKTGFRLI